MPPQRPRRRRLPSVLGGVLVLALVALCCAQVLPFVRARLTWLLLPTSNVAPPACAHETPHSPQAPLQESLFAAVSSIVTSGTTGFINRGVPIIDANVALCVVRSSDGAIIGHYALDESIIGHYALDGAVADLAQADGVLYLLQPQVQNVRKVQVCALRAHDGTRLWCRTSAPTGLPLVLSGGILYLQSESAITALRASDGAMLWTHGIQRGQDGQTAVVEIAVVSDSVYVPASAHQVCVLQAANGTTRWCTSPDSLTAAIGLAADTTGVYALDRTSNSDSPTRVVALRATDGASIWQRLLPRIATVTPSFLAQNGLLYFSTIHSPNDSQNILTALQTSDGTKRWEITTSQELRATVVQGNVAYVADSTSLQALQASTGKLLWKQTIHTADTTRLLVSGSMLYLSDDVQNLFAIKASTGQVLWERIQCIDDSDTIEPEPHTKNGSVVWCTWGTDRRKNGLAGPSALAAGA
jgi:outer membrane protein assembly factor BamB